MPQGAAKLVHTMKKGNQNLSSGQGLVTSWNDPIYQPQAAGREEPKLCRKD